MSGAEKTLLLISHPINCFKQKNVRTWGFSSFICWHFNSWIFTYRRHDRSHFPHLLSNYPSGFSSQRVLWTVLRYSGRPWLTDSHLSKQKEAADCCRRNAELGENSLHSAWKGFVHSNSKVIVCLPAKPLRVLRNRWLQICVKTKVVSSEQTPASHNCFSPRRAIDQVWPDNKWALLAGAEWVILVRTTELTHT